MSSLTANARPAGWRGEPLSLGQLGRVLLNHWILLVVVTLIGGVGGVVAAKVVTPVYTATATMLVKAVPGTTPQANYEAAQYAVARAKAYPTMLYNLTVLEGIQNDLQTTESVVDLRDDLTGTTIVDTPLVQIAAQGATGADARDKANSAVRQLSRFVVQIETVNGRSPISIDIAVTAGAPRQQTSPRPLLYAALGAVVGFALSVAIALIHAYVRSVRPRKDRHGDPGTRRSRGRDAKPRHSVDPADWTAGAEADGAAPQPVGVDTVPALDDDATKASAGT